MGFGKRNSTTDKANIPYSAQNEAEFLHMQLIYKDKANQSLSKIEFPSDFS